MVIAEVNPKSDNAEATSGLIAALLYEIHGLEVYSIIICQVGTIPRTKENFVNIEKLYQAYFAGVLRPLSLSCTNPRKAMENANPKPSGEPQFYTNYVAVLRTSICKALYSKVNSLSMVIWN